MAKTPDKISKYVDPTGEFTNKDLALSSWFVKNRVLLRKILIGVLLTWAIIGGLIALILWGSYLFSGYWKDRQTQRDTIEEFQNFAAFQEDYAAQNLQIDSVKVFQNGDKYDFYAMAVNPNARFSARVKYKYIFENRETQTKTVVIAPGKKFPLGIYGYESAGYPTGARLEIVETLWRKINPHTIPDVAGFIALRTQFAVDYVSIEHNVLNGEVPPRVTFDISNNTAYSYYEGRFAVLLLSGGSVEGVVPLSLKNFRAGDKVPVDIRPSFSISRVDNIDVVPLMDVFDINEFLQIGK